MSENHCKLDDMRQKEIINIRDGTRFGFLNNLKIDYSCGKVTTLIIDGPGRIFGLFGKNREFHIPWESIVQFGDDIILVDVDIQAISIDIDY